MICFEFPWFRTKDPNKTFIIYNKILTSMHSLRSRTYVFSVGSAQPWWSYSNKNVDLSQSKSPRIPLNIITVNKTYSFLRADLRFSSLSSWAASLSLTSDPGALAGMMSNCRSLLWKWKTTCFTPTVFWLLIFFRTIPNDYVYMHIYSDSRNKIKH